MSTYSETEKLAKKFDAAYPGELSARLEWWREALGIDRARLLRMIGMSMRQAGQSKSKDLKEVLECADWKENAQLLEGVLHRLLSLFQYDVQTLRAHIHEAAEKREGEAPSRVRRRSHNGEVRRLRHTPNGGTSDTLINRLAEGGSQSLPVLFTYLAGLQAVAGRGES